ncbi:hypothetical protein BJ138DRAFT_1012981 [Hygrophoropsis aurantiaca]|uniref:Uncharacterized protein n=1 Tax=Hygrophoropsis aurantiaca TaxID=72124 RepID=A0ACB8A4P4_9AGAM|nr:hypothetical protein BJ138DRAFT_1012981 [Hygrophoropsis aurantiaca]
MDCPNCGLGFESAEHVLSHLNDPNTTCWTDTVFDCHLPLPPGSLPNKERNWENQLPDPNFKHDGGGGKYRFHEFSGYTYGKGKNTLEQFESDAYAQQRIANPYFPFPTRGEWELGKFMCETLTQSEMDRFLKLEWAKNKPPTFRNKNTLLDWMDYLPKGPTWYSEEIILEGYQTKRPIQFIYRDAMEVVKQLFGDPVYAGHMIFDPVENELPEGATIAGIVAASDKTPVTRHTGGLKMHPTFVTLANISSDVRMKATAQAWKCVAFVPIVEFDVNSEYQTILQSRLWHKCMDKVFVNLKIAAKVGTFMPDPFGELRYVFTILVAWQADLPEQQLIADVARSASPVTTAITQNFGDAFAHPSRLGNDTLKLLHDLSKRVDPWKLDEFQKESKKLGLMGVNLPFWRNWDHSCPSDFLVPEILHTCHKFFFDHVLVWCKEVLGNDELDARYRVQQKRIGTRHFDEGMSHVLQMTGREHRDIQRTIIPVIAGAVEDDFLRAIRALIDFIYVAQNPVHTPSSIADMQACLAEFHSYKGAILKAEARRGKNGAKDDFCIPKLELFQTFAIAAWNVGSLIQFSADVSERLLITHCKQPFTQTNHQRNFTEQVVRILDRRERIRMFDIYALLNVHHQNLTNLVQEENEFIAAETDPLYAWISAILPDERPLAGPRPIRNHFLKGVLSGDASAAFHLTKAPDERLTLQEAATKFALIDFPYALADYARGIWSPYGERFTSPSEDIGFGSIRVWHKFRLQLVSKFREHVIMPSRVVQALPPSANAKFGKCDVVLLDQSLGVGDEQSRTPIVAQVRIIFEPVARRGQVLPAHLNIPLIYVQNFHCVAFPVQQVHIEMFTVERTVNFNMVNADNTPIRMGQIVPLTSVSHAAELIPVYGPKMDRRITQENVLDFPGQFYLNNYSDKETYQTFLAAFSS